MILILLIRPLGRHVLAQKLNFPISKPVLLSVVIDILISKQYQLSVQHPSLSHLGSHLVVLAGSFHDKATLQRSDRYSPSFQV